ncbi:3-oxoacyl-[acyl-carrier-protein] synthase III C-terminal domain-containing protein [Luteimonas huabeiensis]|uniref:3-oxoacyl-[acyl-carrier-protein] synthase III C-terminal domain-containing protein n=1 Tax=Luteimonas huabeiensis TaxID=1244513 RepID=UPI0004B9732F|nr:3-oxoacyl-[acyl-carrier-protein] synthase III C-terminal domain-containing protein [Luteimonas huabeiensis]
MSPRISPAPPLPLRILGTGCHHPAARIPSTTFDARWQRAAGATFAATGVRERGVAAADETASWMAAEAARAALGAAGLAATDLDAIVSACSVMEQPIPCQAALVQRALGLERSGIPAFDVNATCLSFLVALELAATSIACGRHRRVLVVASEVPSRGLRPDDADTAALFGDGAAAAVLGADEGGGASALLSSRMATYAAGADLCRLRGGGTRLPPAAIGDDDRHATCFEMDGPAIYRAAARHLPRFFASLLADAGADVADLACIVPHQASGGGLDHMARTLRLPPGRVMRILDGHGNQVAASIPHALHHAIAQGRLRRGELCLLLGTGAGLSLGGAVLRY